MNTNTMNGSYRGHGENKPLIFGLLIVMAVIFLIIEVLNKIVHAPSDVIIVCSLLLLGFSAAIPFMLGMKARFAADDYTVTFKEAFSCEVRIPYIEIDEIEVYNKMASIYRRGGHANRYVEVITFKTNDGKEYTFQALMDVHPDSHIAAMLGADKIFEMGKFKILQRFIEQKRKDMYNQL